MGGECCSGKLNDDNVQLDGCCIGPSADQLGRLTPEEAAKQIAFEGSYGDCIKWGMDLFGSQGVGYVFYAEAVKNCILWSITDCGNNPPAKACPNPNAVAAEGGNDVCIAEAEEHVVHAGAGGQFAELGQCYFGMDDSCSCRKFYLERTNVRRMSGT